MTANHPPNIHQATVQAAATVPPVHHIAEVQAATLQAEDLQAAVQAVLFQQIPLQAEDLQAAVQAVEEVPVEVHLEALAAVQAVEEVPVEVHLEALHQVETQAEAQQNYCCHYSHPSNFNCFIYLKDEENYHSLNDYY